MLAPGDLSVLLGNASPSPGKASLPGEFDRCGDWDGDFIFLSISWSNVTLTERLKFTKAGSD